MRKRKFVLFLLLSSWISAAALGVGLTRISFVTMAIEPTGILNPCPRTPTATPDVYLDDHDIYFNNVGYDLTLLLLDEDEDVVYSVFVPSATVTLPSWLAGDYEIRLYPEGSCFYFVGYIIL